MAFSRDWHQAQSVRRTPSELALPQRVFDSLLDDNFSQRLQSNPSMLSRGTPFVDVIYVKENVATGFCDIDIVETTEGGLVVRIPVTWLAMLHVFTGVMNSISPLREMHFRFFPDTRTLDTYIDKCATFYAGWAQQAHNASISYDDLCDGRFESGWVREHFLNMYGLPRFDSEQQKEVPSADEETYLYAQYCHFVMKTTDSLQGNRPPRTVFLRHIPMHERIEFLEFICRKWMRRPLTHFDGTVCASIHYAWKHAILHECAHWDWKHLNTLDSINQIPREYQAPTADRNAAEEYCADMQALDYLLSSSGVLNDRSQSSDRQRCYEQLYAGLMLSYGLQAMVEMESVTNMMAWEKTCTPYPLAWTRWAMVARTLTKRIADVRSDVHDTCVRYIAETARVIDWPALAAIAYASILSERISGEYLDKTESLVAWRQAEYEVLSRIESGETWEDIAKQAEAALRDGSQTMSDVPEDKYKTAFGTASVDLTSPLGLARAMRLLRAELFWSTPSTDRSTNN